MFKVAPAVTAALRANGIKGPVQITAFGDVYQLSRPNQEALSATGINIYHVPQGGKNSADRSLLVDLMCWVSQNPPPAHIFLISSDRDFAGILHRLRMSNYNILLASKESAPSVLCSAASIMWHWSALLKGENITGKYFNHPPDGSYSWYGHYKVPLEDPFSVVEQPQPTCSQTKEVSEAGSDSKPRPVPKAVMKQICRILNSSPEGISLVDLHKELRRSNMSFDKDFYGYKKFSRFLLSMPHILKFKSVSNGQYLIYAVTVKAREPSVCMSKENGSDSENAAEKPTNSQEAASGDDKHIKPVAKKPSNAVLQSHLGGQKASEPVVKQASEIQAERPAEEVLPHQGEHTASKPVAKQVSKIPLEMPAKEVLPHQGEQTASKPVAKQASKIPVEMPANEVPHSHPGGPTAFEGADKQVAQSQVAAVVEMEPTSEESFFEKVWRFWYGPPDYQNRTFEAKHLDSPLNGNSGSNSEEKSSSIPEKCISLEDDSERVKLDGQCPKRPNQDVDKTTLSSSIDVSAAANKTIAEASVNNSEKSTGFFDWFRFGESSKEDSNASGEQLIEKSNMTDFKSQKDEMFSQNSFWKDMESFLHSPRGSELVLQSKTREEMAQNVLKEGPFTPKSLGSSDLLHFADLLISDKKWVEECPSQKPFFRISRAAAKKSCVVDDSRISNGLSSIFKHTPLSPTKLQPDSEGDKKCQNISPSGVSSAPVNLKFKERSRSEIVADCQKLVTETLKENPEGYRVSFFKNLFLEKYGYPIDLQTLGYRKLTSLLETMHGVKIVNNYMKPAAMAPNDSGPDSAAPKGNTTSDKAKSLTKDSSTTRKKDSDVWAELGPVSNTSSNNKEVQSVSRRKTTEETKKQAYYYEPPSLSDDEFSDSEGEMSTAEGKPGIDDDARSSLFEILDSYYISKKGGEEENTGSEKDEDTIDCSRNDGKPNDAFLSDSKLDTLLMENHRRKKRQQRNISFVANQDNRDSKFVEGVLGALTKTSESKMQSR